jgi:hypothetical protein
MAAVRDPAAEEVNDREFDADVSRFHFGRTRHRVHAIENSVNDKVPILSE